MCGRYRNLQSWADLHAALSSFLAAPTQLPLNLASCEQIRPTDRAPIVRMVDGIPVISQARWWLIPFYHKGNIKDWKATTFNARAETVATSPAYRDSFKRRRCLIVADGWYEWSGPHPEHPKRKQPWLFTALDPEPMMFAGIWDRCHAGDDGEVESFSIVIQPAGSPLNTYHDRAPVVLFRRDWVRWLDLAADVSDLLGPESADRFSVATTAI